MEWVNWGLCAVSAMTGLATVTRGRTSGIRERWFLRLYWVHYGWLIGVMALQMTISRSWLVQRESAGLGFMSSHWLVLLAVELLTGFGLVALAANARRTG